jgi:thiamine biosynthesis protein ThiS
VRLIVNGEPREEVDGLTVADLLAGAGEPADHVLVEVNGVYLPPRRFAVQRLADGDRVEIILPAFGG